jgi:hypothetical protein
LLLLVVHATVTFASLFSVVRPFSLSLSACPARAFALFSCTPSIGTSISLVANRPFHPAGFANKKQFKILRLPMRKKKKKK